MTTQSRIDETFSALAAQQQQMAFMPFVTAGDPNLDTTRRLIEELGTRGVDLIEVGIPYSDPIADGPVIQASYTRALDNGFHVDDLFAMVAALDTDSLPPLVAMVAFPIVFRIGPETFLAKAREAGFSGLIVPDLPGDEAGDFGDLVRSHGLDLVQLVSPTTPPARAEKILAAASGFVYCISVAGTTGVRDDLPTELSDQLAWLREKTDLPLAVGFGVSRPEHVDVLRGKADGAIVGSALVRRVEPLTTEGADLEAVVADVGNFAAEMLAACRGG